MTNPDLPAVTSPVGSSLPTRRPWTPDEDLPGGGKRITAKRVCNGCGDLVGDVTDDEIDRAISGLPLDDVTDECLHCLRAQVAELKQRLAAGVAQAEVARGSGTSIVMALTGDPGAVVEADPYGRSGS